MDPFGSVTQGILMDPKGFKGFKIFYLHAQHTIIIVNIKQKQISQKCYVPPHMEL